MAAQYELQIQLTGDGSGLSGVLRTSTGELRTFAVHADESGEALEELSQQSNQAGKSVQGLIGFVKGLTAAWLSWRGVSALVEMADTWSDLSSRVQLAVGEHQRASDVMGRLADISRQTYSSLELTADGFARNAVTLNALGKSTQQQLDYTQALNNALVVSGAKQDRAIMVQASMSKALAEGALRGEEFNNVINYGGRIAELLAEELDVNVTELRALAAQGQITGDIIFSALVENMERLTEEAESMPATIGDAFVLLRNAVLQTVGVFDQQNEISESLAETLIKVADRMGEIISAAALLAKVVVTIYTTRLLASAAAFTAELVLQGVAYARNTSLATAWAAANAASTRQALRSAGLVASAVNLAGAAFAGWQIGKWAREQFLQVELAGIALVEGLLVNWERIKYYAAVAFAGVEYAWDVAIAAMTQVFAGFVRGVAAGVALLPDWAGGASAQGLLEYADGLITVEGAIQKHNARMMELADNTEAYRAGIRETMSDLADEAIARRAAADQTQAQADAIATANTALQAATALTEEAIRARKAFRDIERDILDQAADMAAQLAGPAAVAQRGYEVAIRDVREQMDALDAAQREAGLSTLDLMAARQAAASVEQGLAQRRDRALRVIERERDVVGRLKDEYAEQHAVLGMTARQYAIHQAQTEAVARATDDLGEALEGLPDDLEEIRRQAGEMAGDFFDASSAAYDLEEILSRFDQIGFGSLTDEIRLVQAALAEATDPAVIERLQRALGGLRQQGLESIVGSSQLALRSMQSLASEGSDAYKAMEVASHALNVALAAGAILNQGKGDPYTAFARMAAMAAAVSGLVGSIGFGGGGGGGGGGGAAERQAMQGTGSVLGDSAAQSESILRATQITADATRELVGINRGMLRALTALQAGIGAASGMLARGAGGADFGPAGAARLDAGSRFAITVTNALTGGVLGGLTESVTRSLLGARSRISDAGILIGGGIITQIMDGISVGAYQTTQSRSWWGGSTRTRDQVEQIDDGVGRQFELILGSIVDSVREGALALGLSADDIDAAIQAFHVEEVRISTMDLSAEEQQAALEAVFSTIFDGLAGAVVPFVAQFQRIGEGLGETLVRVATGVQVTQEAVARLGFALDETDPERFAQISEGLIDLAGGLDEFIAGMQSFFGAFAPDDVKFDVLEDELTRALDQVGLSIPPTRDAMWELMQSLDATTAEGREQIAMLLQLADVSDTYYSLLEQGAAAVERAAQQYSEFIASFAAPATAGPIADIRRREQEAIEQAHAMAEAAGLQAAATADLAEISAWAEREIAAVQAQFAQGMVSYRAYIDAITDRRPYESAHAAIMRERDQQLAQAHELARAAGLQGAATRDVGRIHLQAAAQVVAATLRIRAAIQDIVGQLTAGGTFVPGQGYVEQALSDFESGAAGAIGRIDDAAARMYQAQLAGIQRIHDYLVSMQFGGLSALSPMEQLDAARQQLEVLQQAALAGDADAMSALPQAAQQYLQLLQGAYASGSGFTEGYDWVQQLLQAVVDQGPTVDDPGAGGAGTWDGYPGLTPDALRERDELLVAQEAEYRAALAGQLAEHLGQLAELVNAPVLELAGLLGITLDGLVADLGINLEHITGASVVALAELADALGISLGILAGELGLELTDLGGGIGELLGNMGHSLDEITGSTVEAMAGLGAMLGLSLGEMVTALGLELTDLAGGLTELTTELGIELDALTVESTQALAALAAQLGLDLGEMTTALGVDLGALTDSQSLLNQTFAAELAGLPERERNLLAPLFDAVTDATSDADANAAIAELEGAVNDLSPAIREQLAPYLEGVFPADAMSDLDFLGSIDTSTRALESLAGQQLSSLNSVSTSTSAMRSTLSAMDTTMDRIRSNLREQNRDAGLPHFAAGGWVRGRTTLVAGEAGDELILPAHVSSFLAREGIPLNSAPPAADTRELAARLERIEAAIERSGQRQVEATEGSGRAVAGAVEDLRRDTHTIRSGH